MTIDIDDTPEPIPDQLPPEWKWLYEKGYNAGLRATEAEMLNQQHDITRLQANLTAEAEARIAAEAGRDALRALLTEVTEAKRRNWEQSPEGRAYLAKIDAALLASRGKP